MTCNRSSTQRKTGWNRLRRAGGFSAIELMVTVGIMGLVLAAAVPSFRTSLSTHRLDSAADQVSAKFRLLRAQAVAENTPYLVYWLESGGQDWFLIYQDNDRSGALSFGDVYQDYFKLNETLSVTNCTSGGFPGTQVGFFPNGSSSVGGCFEITNDKGVSLTINVLQPSGAVNVSRN